MAGHEDRGLAVEEQNAAVHQRFAREVARVVHQVSGREVVGAVHHHVVLRDDFHRVVGSDRRIVNDHVYVRVVGAQSFLRRLRLRLPHVLCLVQHLALKVRQVDEVAVDYA